MTHIKICGVTTLDDALLCAETGADLLGLNFYPPSPRSLSLDAARVIAEGLRATLGQRCPLLVGVFVNAAPDELKLVQQTVGLDAVQLSGDEPLATTLALSGRAIKALRPQSVDEALAQLEAYRPAFPGDLRLPSLLLDAYHPALYGGTGAQASLEIALAVRARVPRLLLAGGLTPDNVGERVRAIQPWGVDVASGVEGDTPGVKDPARVRAFISAVREEQPA